MLICSFQGPRGGGRGGGEGSEAGQLAGCLEAQSGSDVLFRQTQCRGLTMETLNGISHLSSFL